MGVDGQVNHLITQVAAEFPRQGRSRMRGGHASLPQSELTLLFSTTSRSRAYLDVTCMDFRIDSLFLERGKELG